MVVLLSPVVLLLGLLCFWVVVDSIDGCQEETHEGVPTGYERRRVVGNAGPQSCKRVDEPMDSKESSVIAHSKGSHGSADGRTIASTTKHIGTKDMTTSTKEMHDILRQESTGAAAFTTSFRQANSAPLRLHRGTIDATCASASMAASSLSHARAYKLPTIHCLSCLAGRNRSSSILERIGVPLAALRLSLM